MILKHMISLTAEYKVKKQKVQETKDAIAAFVSAVHKQEPGTVHYEAFQLPDKVSFIHFMTFKDKKSQKFHQSTTHCEKFVECLYPNCEVEPKFTEVKNIE